MNHKEKSCKREAEMGFGDEIPKRGDWGMKSPIVPHAKRNRESSQGAKRNLTDG